MTTSQLQEKKMLGTITNMEAASRARGTYPMNVYWGGACLDLLRIRISQIAASVESRGMNLMHSLFFLKATSSVKTKQNKNSRRAEASALNIWAEGKKTWDWFFSLSLTRPKLVDIHSCKTNPLICVFLRVFWSGHIRWSVILFVFVKSILLMLHVDDLVLFTTRVSGGWHIHYKNAQN